MNCEDNFFLINADPRIHFISTYSTYFSKDLIHVDMKKFHPVDRDKNRVLPDKGRSDDLGAYRTAGEYWGKERTLVVTYNPRTATRQRYSFEKKLLRLSEEIDGMRSRVNGGEWHWTDSKIRCHIFTCIVALTCLRRIGLRLKRAGDSHECCCNYGLHAQASLLPGMEPGQEKARERVLEEPTARQTAILKAFGYQINKGVLQ